MPAGLQTIRILLKIMKKAIPYCFIVFLLALPFVTRYFLRRSLEVPKSDEYEQTERYIDLHKGRVEEQIKLLRQQNLDESFLSLLNEQQYSYPGVRSELFDAPQEMEELLSSRGFLKVFQQFKELPQTQAIDKLHQFHRDAFRTFNDSLEKMQYIAEPLTVPSSTSPQTSVMGAKYRVYAVLLLTAFFGEHKLLVEQINEVQSTVDKCINRFKKDDTVPPPVLRVLPRLLSLEDDCILSVLMYALQRAGTEVKTDVPLNLLNQKTIPLFRWDAEATFYDILSQQGYQKIVQQDAVENIDIYSFPRDGTFDDEKRKSVINTLKTILLK